MTEPAVIDSPMHSKLLELSKRTGISIETLRTVRRVEKQVSSQRRELDKTVTEVDSKRKVE